MLPGPHHLEEELPVEAGGSGEPLHHVAEQPVPVPGTEPPVDPPGAHRQGQRRQRSGHETGLLENLGGNRHLPLRRPLEELDAVHAVPVVHQLSGKLPSPDPALQHLLGDS